MKCAYILSVAIIAIASLIGCSSNSNSIQVGPIAFTDANGNPAATAPTSLTVGSTVYLDVTLTNDNQDLGANWSVYCGSALPPGTPLPSGETVDPTCGTFTPVHTSSGPVPQFATSGVGIVTLFTAPAVPPKGGVITLYAASTANPSKYSSVTLTMEGLPISVALAPAPPAALNVNATATIKAVLTNDYLGQGVTWKVTCASSSCGSFNPSSTASGGATTFTAPSAVPTGGVVTITATSVTDPTKSASAAITIDAATQASRIDMDRLGRRLSMRTPSPRSVTVAKSGREGNRNDYL